MKTLEITYIDLSEYTLQQARKDYDALVVASSWNAKSLDRYKNSLPPVLTGMLTNEAAIVTEF